MIRSAAILLGLAFAARASAQIATPERTCGAPIKTDAVLLVDLSSFAGDPAGGIAFLDKQLHDTAFDLLGTETQTLRTRKLKKALPEIQSIAAKRGCNLVIVLGLEGVHSGRYIGSSTPVGDTVLSDAVEVINLHADFRLGTRAGAAIPTKAK